MRERRVLCYRWGSGVWPRVDLPWWRGRARAAGLHVSARHDAACSSRAPEIARDEPPPCRLLRTEPQDGRQRVALAHLDRRRANGAISVPPSGPDRGRGCHRGGVPAPPHAAVLGRTVGQAERINRTLKDATVKAIHSPTWKRRRPAGSAGDIAAAAADMWFPLIIPVSMRWMM